jgi:hypothetical protein
MATFEPPQVAFLMTVLKHSELNNDWKEVASEAGISLVGNA